MKKQIQISKLKKFYSQKELLELGLSYFMINKMVQNNQLHRLNRNHYENLEYEGEEQDFYIVSAINEEGIVCLLSAAVYYGLSTHRPLEIDVAIRRKGTISKLPDRPKIKLYFFDEHRYSYAITIITEGENTFKIYDVEKTVCDLLVYRNKIGLEAAIEVLKKYLSLQKRDLNKLIAYSEELNCYPLLSKYLEVLV
jgi:predicted transcriptional regulator of viral defense system